MADNQVYQYLMFSIKDPSKNKRMFSWIVKNCSPKKPLPELDTSRISDWDSKHPNKLLNPISSIKNVHSPATYQSEERFSRVLSFQPKCKEQSSSEEIIFITFPNITDMRKDTETFQFTAHPLSQSKKETLLSLVNADLCAKLYTSMSLKSSPTTLSVTSENNSCYFEEMINK